MFILKGERKMLISIKDELYTFDELNFLQNAISDGQNDSLPQKIQKLADSLKQNPKTQAIFFMPRQSYEIFSIFQNSAAVCDFSANDAEILAQKIHNFAKNPEELLKIANIDCKNPKNAGTFVKSLYEKLSVLKNFLLEGNQVFPVVTVADNLSEIQF